jgi:hypothetical protein
VDLAGGKEVKIAVGLHPAGMAISGSNLYMCRIHFAG